MDAFIMLVAAIRGPRALRGLAVQYGVDSRDDSTDPRRSPYPIGINP